MIKINCEKGFILPELAVEHEYNASFMPFKKHQKVKKTGNYFFQSHQ
ncbi:hypothetical protein DCCM_2396 [Desulfocucumis palustris]|uniref:Uncharacterized protein n=1 Tax=Desulfocucumis palustris TaxID=1898651 RepID=A0A2L2XAJ7_9FIRM|nr:hypothetical protein DCCM_2396 [Desulfocucumis palustris]